MTFPFNVIGPYAGAVATVAAISPPVVSLATSIGTFFAPATAAAGGGAVNIIAASAAGSLITFIPGTIGIVVAGLLLITGFNTGSEKLITAAIILGIVDLVATYLLAAKIGASIAGVAASSVILCNVIGGAAIMLGLAVAAGVLIAAGAACLSTFAESVAPGSMRR